MPCPHNEISIVQRSQQQSAIAAAAYQSGEKLFCEYDQQVKHYPEKRGIVHNEILLPANAPQKYADRNTLWNAAEAVEKQWNSQLARRWVLTIPREIPPDQYAVLVREFCEQQFVSKGMIADFAIHDPHPPGHNPHAHVLLTMRAMDEHGKWLPKSRKVYDLDENGERIKLPSGRWKSHKEDTVDWNDQKYCEIWRHEWEVIQNRYLEANDRPERVDLRSYARQGLDIVPTVHEGAAVRQMEKRGIQTNIGNLNREIRAANRLMKSIRQLIQNLKGWITELGEKRKELLAQKAAEEATLLPNLLMKYMEIRKEERKDWTRAGQNRGTSQDLKAVSEALSYLRQKGLSTVEDLEAFLESSGKSAADYRNQMKPKEARSKVISSCGAMFSGMMNGVLGTSYTSEDSDLVATENNYAAKETELQQRIDNIERDNPGYDEYRYDLDNIGHNPHELASYLTALLQSYTPQSAQAELNRVFDKQYTLTLTEEIEVRYRTETRTDTWTDEDGNSHSDTYTVEVPYNYYILNVKLTNKPINSFVSELLTVEQLEMYRVYLETSGNKPLIFGGGSPDVSASEDLSGVQFVNGTRPGNTAIVDLAKRQVGNVGGQPYWSWYGFNSRVEWCACFVSWCYGQMGLSEPRFAACQSQGIPWFTSRGQWGARGYENIAPGDAIFFDWDLDGSADHVGLVIGTDGSRVYTVEGNSGDACKIKSYPLDYACIKGYGLMNWN